jgi:transcriptional regulator with XRE-family HTH domain
MRRPHRYAAATLEATKALGLEIARSRRQRRWTAADLAERAGVSLVTLRKVERGDPTVAIGTVFDIAVLLGVPLFNVDRGALSGLVTRAQERLAVLPARVRQSAGPVHDAF